MKHLFVLLLLVLSVTFYHCRILNDKWSDLYDFTLECEGGTVSVSVTSPQFEMLPDTITYWEDVLKDGGFGR